MQFTECLENEFAGKVAVFRRHDQRRGGAGAGYFPFTAKKHWAFSRDWLLNEMEGE